MSATMVFCRGCGSEIHESASACPKCGAAQVQKQEVTRNALIGAYVLAAVIPIAGVIMGIYLAFKGKLLHAVLVVVVSILMISFWAGFWPAFEHSLNAQ